MPDTPTARPVTDLHDTNTCPDEDCPACIQGCLGCRRKYVRTIDGYCARCVEDEVWRVGEMTDDPTRALVALSARIEDTYGFGKRMAFVWLSNGDKGYRLTMPVDLAEALVERLTDA